MRSSSQSALICAMVILTAALYGCGGNDTGLAIVSPDDPGHSPVVAASHDDSHNDMIDAANADDRATGLVTRIGTTNGMGGIDAAAEPSSLNNSDTIVQSSQTDEPGVDVSASWPSLATSPTLSVNLERQAFGAFRRILPNSVPIASPTSGNAIPDLGGKWNGEALKREVSQGGTTVYTVVYSDIEQAGTIAGGTAYLDLRAGVDEEGKPIGEDAGLELRNALGMEVGTLDPAEVQRVDGTGLSPDLNLAREKLTTSPFQIGAKSYQLLDSESAWTRPVRLREKITIDLYDIEARTTVQADLTCVNGRPGAAADSCEAVRRTKAGSVEGLWQISLVESNDDAYLSLGAWLSLPDYADGRFDVGAFAEGSMPYTRAALNALTNPLTGDVKYEGPATGIWAKGVYERPRASTDGRPDDCNCEVVKDTEVGAFSAQTHLWANFGTSGDAPMVDGYVHDFRENGASLGSWFVQLDNAMPADDTTTLLNGATSGEADGRLLQGQWGVRFFQREAVEISHPGYAAGTFSASTVDENTPLDLNALHLIGAFGTERQP